MNRPKHYLAGISTLLTCFLAVASAWGVSADNVACINVQDFGAKGDGVADDTAAIQRAFNHVSGMNAPVHWKGRGIGFQVRPEVFFPSGRYRITDTIRIPAYRLVVVGRGNPSIELEAADKDIFFAECEWQASVRGITFLGGRTQVSMGNPNSDKGKYTLEACKFYCSSAPAVVFRKGSNSTQALIRDCVFSYCDQALLTYCDYTVLRECWMTSSGSMTRKAVIVNARGSLTCENIVGVPRAGGIDQRWIDNHGLNLVCRQFRFGGEGGGFTPVVNFARYRTGMLAPRILLDQCELYGLTNLKRKSAVYCEEVPNRIQLNGCFLGGISPVSVATNINLRTYFEGVSPSLLKYSVTDCISPLPIDLPELLASPILNDDPEAERPLSTEVTADCLAKAVKAVLARESLPHAALVHNDHRQHAEPGSFIEITPGTHEWDLDDMMDGTVRENSDFLAVSQAGDDIVIMRRLTGSWPHVRIKNVMIDVDETPFLTWRLHDAKTGMPNRHAVKLFDRDTGQLVTVAEIGHGWHEYLAFDLRTLLQAGGKHNLDILFYYLGSHYHGPTAERSEYYQEYAQPGDYLLLDFLRAEKE